MNKETTPRAKTSCGFMDLSCPACGEPNPETTCIGGITDTYDPNTKRCTECKYAWRQINE